MGRASTNNVLGDSEAGIAFADSASGSRSALPKRLLERPYAQYTHERFLVQTGEQADA